MGRPMANGALPPLTGWQPQASTQHHPAVADATRPPPVPDPHSHTTSTSTPPLPSACRRGDRGRALPRVLSPALPLAGEAIDAGVKVAVCSTSNERAVSNIVRVMLGPRVAAVMRVFAGDVVSSSTPRVRII